MTRLIQTFSRSDRQWPANAPHALIRGRGAHVWAKDGTEYLDLTLALGPMVLGYGDPDVNIAVADALSDGPIFSRDHPLIDEVAIILTDAIPCAEDGLAKFGLSGSDATTAAVRCARAATGRQRVISQGYHGWHDWCCPNRTGLPHTTGDHEDREDPSIERTTDWREHAAWADYTDIAAIIVEPEYTKDLYGLRDCCTKNGIVLIFDEVLTGFRVAIGGYQEIANITPDLACYSKAMGNGLPVSAVVGRADIMRAFDRTGVSGTFLGWTGGLAATKAVITKMWTEPVIPRLWDVGESLKAAFDVAAKRYGVAGELRGLPPRMTVHFAGDEPIDPAIGPSSVPWRTLWSQLMCERGVLANFGLAACYAMSDTDVRRVCEAIQDTLRAMGSISDPAELLIGEPSLPSVRAA